MKMDETFFKETRQFIFEWYKQADTKAQTILGFTGIFLSIIVVALISIPIDSKLALIFGTKRDIILVLLSLAILFYCVSIVLSAMALWSRGVFEYKKKGFHFFGHIANYKSFDELKEDFCTTNTANYEDQLINDIFILSKNTLVKHRLINLAVVLSGSALIFTIISTILIFLS